MQATVAATRLCSESKAQALTLLLKCNEFDGFEVNLLADILAFADNSVVVDVNTSVGYRAEVHTVRVDRRGLVGQLQQSYIRPIYMQHRVERGCGTCGRPACSLRDVYPVPTDTTPYFSCCVACPRVWCTVCGPPCAKDASRCNACYDQLERSRLPKWERSFLTPSKRIRLP